MKKIVTNLTTWVLIAIVSGALLGHFKPTTAVAMQPLGKYFIELVKLFINPIIFLTISLGISGMNDLKKVGRVGGKAILYFEIVTTLALMIGIIVAHYIQPGNGVNTTNISGGDISKFTEGAKNFSWTKFFQDNATIQVLIFSILFGTIR
jgi:aerobic C4-dicarboxylate transport protein